MKRSGKRPLVTTPLVWYHGSYLINLPDQSPAERRRQFGNMIGTYTWTILRTGPVQSPEQLQSLYRQVALVNNWRARLAGEKSWTKVKVIVWRGCWCLAERDSRRW